MDITIIERVGSVILLSFIAVAILFLTEDKVRSSRPLRKCIVARCDNWSDAGYFEGPLCRPCAEALRGYLDINGVAAQNIIRSLAHR